MQARPSQPSQTPAPDTPAPDASSGVSLLAAVDFKWLMTGHGWWVDPARFHADPSYAATMLDLAISSPSSALRECAARLLVQMGIRDGGRVFSGSGFAASGPGSL